MRQATRISTVDEHTAEEALDAGALSNSFAVIFGSWKLDERRERA
jgi:hypothetical protein